MITTVTGKNQVTIPAEIAGKAGLKPGSRLEWRLTHRKDVLEVRVLPDQAAVAQALRGRGKKSQKNRGSPVDRLIAERSHEDRGRA